MITEDYVSFDVAKLLKEKGFDNDVLITDWWYDDSGISHKRGNYSYSGAPLYDKKTCFNCPTIQLAIKWLREKHRFFINIQRCKFKFFFAIESMDESSENEYSLGHFKEFERSTYEEACEAAIRYTLENLI